MDNFDHQGVKYFWETLDFKYHLGFPWGVPQPPNPLPPKMPIWGPIGGHGCGGHIISLTPKCDMFLDSP